jgi:hypothetical protein
MNKFGLIPRNGNLNLNLNLLDPADLVHLSLPLEIVENIIRDSKTKRVEISLSLQDGNDYNITINKQNDGTYNFSDSDSNLQELNQQGIIKKVNERILRPVVATILSIYGFDDNGNTTHIYTREDNYQTNEANNFGKKRNTFTSELKYLQGLK